MSHEAASCALKLLSPMMSVVASMPREMGGIGRAVLYNAGSGRAFSAGERNRYCRRVLTKELANACCSNAGQSQRLDNGEQATKAGHLRD